MVIPETFTDVLSTLYIVCRDGEKKERGGVVIVKKYYYYYYYYCYNYYHPHLIQVPPPRWCLGRPSVPVVGKRFSRASLWR